MSGRSKVVAGSSWALVAALAVALILGFTTTRVAYASDVSIMAASDIVTTVPGDDGDASNIKGYTNFSPVFRYGWQQGRAYSDRQATFKTLDITGDTYPDTIKVTSTKSSSSSPYLNKVKIAINGKNKKTISASGIDRVAVSVMTLKNNKPFLWVEVVRKNSKVSQTLYQYQNGKLKAVLSNADFAATNTSNCYVSYISSSGNTLKFTYTIATSVTGLTKMTYTYKYKSGTLQRTSNTTSKISYVTKSNGGFTKNKVTAAGKFVAYKNTKLDTQAFAVKVDKKVQPVSVTFSGGKMYYKLKYGGKTGWIACPKVKKQSKHAPSTMFYETYGKVKLSTSIPTYSKDTYYKAADLQQYSDHSLFIARNEIAARSSATKTFSLPELKSYFNAKSWYPVKTARTRTAAENANIKLIQSIEENRGSLYVN